MADLHREEESNPVNPTNPAIRSPRERLGGYILLPRLIDKVRLHAEGRLPQAYLPYLLKPGPGMTLDGRFLAFTGLDGEGLRGAILASRSDKEVLAWVANGMPVRIPRRRSENGPMRSRPIGPRGRPSTGAG